MGSRNVFAIGVNMSRFAFGLTSLRSQSCTVVAVRSGQALQAIHLHGSESAHSWEKNPRHKSTCDLFAQIFVLGYPKSAQEKGR
mmetsp:Transcript_86034/g.136682  ORF Transcript_86034/g.136682 Transcript_86034/m.136682 type:complete len:84 (+) Transcript_86034:235-486(+)